MDVLNVFKRQLEVTKIVYDMDFCQLKEFGEIVEEGCENDTILNVKTVIKSLNDLDDYESIRLANELNITLNYSMYELRESECLKDWYGREVYNLLSRLEDVEIKEFFFDDGYKICFIDIFEASERAKNIIKYIITNGCSFEDLIYCMSQCEVL